MVYIQIASEDQRADAEKLRSRLAQDNFRAPGIQVVKPPLATVHTYVRFFSAPGAVQAARVTDDMNALNYKAVGVQDFSAYTDKPYLRSRFGLGAVRESSDCSAYREDVLSENSEPGKAEQHGGDGEQFFEKQEEQLFPVIFGTILGEFEPVEIFRISQRDTREIAGTNPPGSQTKPALAGPVKPKPGKPSGVCRLAHRKGDRWAFKPALMCLITVTALQLVCQIPGWVGFLLIPLSALGYLVVLIAILVWAAYCFIKKRGRRGASLLLVVLLPVLLWLPINWVADVVHIGLTRGLGLGQLGSSSKSSDGKFIAYDWSVGLAISPSTFLLYDATDEVALPLPQHTRPQSSELGFAAECAGKVHHVIGHDYICSF